MKCPKCEKEVEALVAGPDNRMCCKSCAIAVMPGNKGKKDKKEYS